MRKFSLLQLGAMALGIAPTVVLPYGGPSDAQSGPMKWGDASKRAPGYMGG